MEKSADVHRNDMRPEPKPEVWLSLDVFTIWSPTQTTMTHTCKHIFGFVFYIYVNETYNMLQTALNHISFFNQQMPFRNRQI